ncbi:MAG TPA: type II toxin-antitoxin system VapC family toxin [Candidatus Limnocylindrales bacterium]|nr:type II toxin-antitoxin system VapC family toxin [Candidatus Limnocylindrales bacterium]
MVDSNILLDVITGDTAWAPWSSTALAKVATDAALVINPLVYAEVSIRYDSIEELESALPQTLLRREDLPFNAGFLAGKAYVAYRNRGGTRRSLLPDFLIGAHAAIAGYRILTRDPRRYRSYFPTVELISPA